MDGMDGSDSSVVDLFLLCPFSPLLSLFSSFLLKEVAVLRKRRCFCHLIKKLVTPCFLHLSNPTERQRQRHTDRESVCIYTPPPSPPSSHSIPQESPSLTYFALPYPSFIPSSYLFLFPSLLHSTIYLSTPQPRRPRTANPKKQYPITSQCI